MSEHETTKAIRRARLGKRRRLILGYWLVQSVLIYVSAPLLACTTLRELGWVHENLIYPGTIVYGLTLVAVVTMLQLVFVLPVRPPGKKGDGPYRVPTRVKLLLCASAATPIGLAAALVQVGCELLFGDAWLLFVDGEPELTFWIYWAIGLLLVAPLVWRFCRDDLSPLISAFVAGACTASLSLAAVLGAGTLFELITDKDISDATWVFLGGIPVVVTWAVATPLLLAFIRKRDTESALKRLASLIFLGTAVETLAIIPFDVFVRRKGSCYCAEGSFWSLVLLVPLGFLALGPMVFLVAVAKRRQRWAQGQCEICGYDMSATPKAERCPECGAGWKPPDQAALADDDAV